MFSSANNRESSQTTYRLFGKLTQKFGSEESNEENSSATIKNAFFTIQGDYTNNKYTYVDADHQFDLFKYGYVGEFHTFNKNIYICSPLCGRLWSHYSYYTSSSACRVFENPS